MVLKPLVQPTAKPNNGMQRSADTLALIYGKGASRPLMPGVSWLFNEYHTG